MAQKKTASARATTAKTTKTLSGGGKSAPAKVPRTQSATKKKTATHSPAGQPAAARTTPEKKGRAATSRSRSAARAKTVPKEVPKAAATAVKPSAASLGAKKPPPHLEIAKKPGSSASVRSAPAGAGKSAPHKPTLHPAALKPQRGAAAARSVPIAIGKPASHKFAAPFPPRDIAFHAAGARQEFKVAKKPVNQRHGFKTNEWIVYPAHGVGRIVGIEEQEIAGMTLELFVIQFEKDKMTLRVPTGKLQSVGMRKLSVEKVVARALETLKGRARIKRTMWSRRAQEYEAKINSGDLISIAEVVRDLYRYETQPEQSYSERQLYEAALDRMAREIAAVDKIDERSAVQRITEILAKSARGRHAAEEAAANGADIEAA